MRSIVKGSLYGLLALALSATLAFPQTETAQITGSVKDPSEGLVPNAKVTLKSVGTSFARTVTTDNRGIYIVTSLQPGRYKVSVEAPGFSVAQQVVELPVGGKVAADFKLELGKSDTVVEVAEKTTAVVNAETQTLGTLVTTKEVVDLPTLTRNPYDLVRTAGNVSEADPSGRGAGVAINGLRAASTNILLDGVNNNDEFTATAGQSVPLDAVQEFSVLTNNFTAEYGRASGGIVNATTKSGTNSYHGTAYEFNRNSKLASNGCVANPARGSDRLYRCANYDRPYSNGDTSNQRSFFVRSAGICDIPSRIVTWRNF